MAPTGTITIRAATPHDAQALADVRVASIRGVCAGTGLYTPDEIDRWVGNRPLSDYHKMIADDPVFVADAGPPTGELAGFGRLQGPKAEPGGTVCWVKGLFVRPALVGGGIGRRLLARLVDTARARHADRVDLVATLNAESFYTRNGFVSLGRIQHTTATGAVIPGIKMTLALAGA